MITDRVNIKVTVLLKIPVNTTVVNIYFDVLVKVEDDHGQYFHLFLTCSVNIDNLIFAGLRPSQSKKLALFTLCQLLPLFATFANFCNFCDFYHFLQLLPYLITFCHLSPLFATYATFCHCGHCFLEIFFFSILQLIYFYLWSMFFNKFSSISLVSFLFQYLCTVTHSLGQL